MKGAVVCYILSVMKDFRYNGTIKMIALDLDGTTLNSAGEISERTQDAFLECKKRGIHVVVSTGRAYNSLPPCAKEVPGIEYAITSNGAHINDIATGEAIYDDYLLPETADEIARLKEVTGAEIEVFIGGIAYINQSYYDYVDKNGCLYRNREYILWSRRPVEDVTALMLEHRDEIENVNFCYPSVEKLEEAKPLLNGIKNATVTSSFPNNLEVGGPNTSKKAALIELTKRLGIKREELMCCGDAPNDIQMLEYAGLGVAVANAWGGAIDYADYVTDSNNDDGVAKAIERFALK